MLDTIKSVLTFITENKVLLIAAIAVVCEVVVTLVNLYRKFKGQPPVVLTESVVKAVDQPAEEVKPLSTVEMVKWSVNPLNLFKSAK